MTRLEEFGLKVENLLAYAGFSSGENYAMLEDLITRHLFLCMELMNHPEASLNAKKEETPLFSPKGQILKQSYTKSDHGRKQVALRQVINHYAIKKL